MKPHAVCGLHVVGCAHGEMIDDHARLKDSRTGSERLITGASTSTSRYSSIYNYVICTRAWKWLHRARPGAVAVGGEVILRLPTITISLAIPYNIHRAERGTKISYHAWSSYASNLFSRPILLLIHPRVWSVRALYSYVEAVDLLKYGRRGMVRVFLYIVLLNLVCVVRFEVSFTNTGRYCP